MKKPSRLMLIAAAAMLASFAGGFALAAQPHMQSALDSLNSAKSELESADADKGGHRKKAIELVDQAVAEVQAGIQAGAN